MKYLIILSLILTGCSAFKPTDNKTSIYLGYGYPWKADNNGSQNLSASIERNGWKVGYTHRDSHTRTPWAKEHPEWPLIPIKRHSVLAVTREAYRYNINKECNLFFDLGLSYTTKISRETSSPISFHENLGAQCGIWRFQFTHDSNAGLVPPNTGSDDFMISFKLWGD